MRAKLAQINDAPNLESPGGQVELIRGREHFTRIVRDGLLKAKVSIDIATADFKAMLIPEEGLTKPRGRRRNDAPSIIQRFRRLADRGVEIRILHSGVPSSPALRELRSLLPAGLTIRRCPRIHMKAIVVDMTAMYLGSANLTGAGLGAKADHRRNFELGIWTTSQELIDGVLSEFNAIWEGEHCSVCQRRDVCPVPLEEPDLAE